MRFYVCNRGCAFHPLMLIQYTSQHYSASRYILSSQEISATRFNLDTVQYHAIACKQPQFPKMFLHFLKKGDGDNIFNDVAKSQGATPMSDNKHHSGGDTTSFNIFEEKGEEERQERVGSACFH